MDPKDPPGGTVPPAMGVVENATTAITRALAFSLSLLSSPFSLLLPGALFRCSWQPLEGRKRECRQKR